MKNTLVLFRALIALLLVCAMTLSFVACGKTPSDTDTPPTDGPDDETPTPSETTEYTVSFDTDGGSTVPAQKVTTGGYASAPEAPTRDGFTFAAWTLNGVDYDFTAPVTGDITLIARWVAMGPYTVTFKDVDGTVLKTEEVPLTETATPPADPSRPGYAFIGWDTAYDRITGDLTVTAQYIRLWTVQFKDYDGTSLKTEEVRDGEAATAPANPTRDGFTFTGWDTVFTSVTGNLIVTAVYSQNPVVPTTYTVSFDTLGFGTIPAQTVIDGATATKPADPVRTGWTFSGWTLNGASYNFSTPVTGSITLVATYTENPVVPPVEPAYTATFTDEDGNVLKTEKVAAGDTHTPPPTPYKMHYAFTEWTISEGSIESGAVTYRATYAPIRHVVTFNHANGTGDTTPVTVDDCAAVSAQTAPTYDGYTFLYWANANGEKYDFTTLVTKDITLTAKYERNAEIPAPTTGNIVINPGYLEFWSGLELQLNIQANVTNTESATKVSAATTDVHYDGFTYTFYTDNTAVLTITADGTITPVSVGTARVWAVIHTGGTQTYNTENKDYTKYDTFTVADGTVLSPVEIRIIEKPDYLQLAESDPENQQIQLGTREAIDINNYLAKPTGDYGSANIALWYNDTTAVMTITIDDNIVSDFNQWTEWSKTYGVPMSVFAITRNYELYGNRWADMTALGNQVQPHGQNHHAADFYNSGYLTSAQAWYDSYVSKQVIEATTGERALVFSYPCGYNAAFNNILYIGGRGVSTLPVNPAKINYNSIDLQGFPDENTIKGLFDPTASERYYKYGGWFNRLQHNIGTEKSLYEAYLPLAKTYIDSGELWAALFSAACQYGQERDTATISNMDAGADVITFTLTDRMNDLLFDHALTVKIKVDNTWTGARAYQNGAECETRIVTEGGETYVYVNAIPDRGEVKVIRSAVEGLSEDAARITFTPTGINGGEGENGMTFTFTVNGDAWTNAYALQNSKVLPTRITTYGGKTTLRVSCAVNGGEVVVVPVTDQYDSREHLTMYEVWQGLVTPDGTKPVLISTAEDLVMLSEYVRNHGVNAGVTFRMTNDIDMADVTDFRPIGWQTDPNSNGDKDAQAAFSGIFDGAEHTICNLTVKNNYVSYIGLFGYTENATITRLTVIGEMEGLGRVGGIVGRMVGGSMNGVIFKGSVTAVGDKGFNWTGSRVGGLVGQIQSATLKNCAAYASVVAHTTGRRGYVSPTANNAPKAGSYVGGIFGEVKHLHQATTQSTFNNIIFEGTVTAHEAPDGTGAAYVGGFGGYIVETAASNITVKADVTGRTHVGGFGGYISHENFLPSTYTNCAVSGTVTGDDYVAGFAGRIDANNTQKLYNCISTVVVNAAAGAEHVGALYGDTPYGTQNTTSQNTFYIEALNPGMAPHPGTVKANAVNNKGEVTTYYCAAMESVDAALVLLNNYATKNALPAWRIVDGNPSASYFPVYTITILDRDGNIIEEQAVGHSLDVVLPEIPFYTGYEFVEWSGTTTGITSGGTIRMIYREVETYTVTYYDREGDIIDSQIINTGRDATPPTPTEYERYWFIGWDKVSTNITADTDITAQYTDAYYVTFSYKAADGTTTTENVKTASGTAAVAPSIPPVDGYTFSGWDKTFDNVTADMTVTAQYITVTKGPVTLNVLQWTLTSAPSNAYFNTLTGSEIILYTGTTDITTATLPTGWEAKGAKHSGQVAGLNYSAVIYNTSVYGFDSVAGIYHVAAVANVTNGSFLAVPLIDLASNQQVVVSVFSLGEWASANSFGTWGKTEKAMKSFLPTLTAQFSAASGIVMGINAQTRSTNENLVNSYTTCDDTTAYVEGYDLKAHYEVDTALDSKTYAEYVLTFMKDGREATLNNAATIAAADGISTNNGMRYSITFDDAAE